MKEKQPEFYKPLPRREPEYQYIPSAEEVENILKNAVLAKFERFKAGKEFYDYGSPSYDYLDSKGLITMTTDVRNRIFEMAKKEVAQEKGIAPSTMNARVKLERELGIEITAKSRAKKIALGIYFDGLVEQGKELKEPL